MNLVLLFEDDFVDETKTRVRLDGRRLRHLRKILRVEPGDRVAVGLAGGEIGQGEVLAIDRRSAELEVTLGSPPPAPLDVILVLALPRPPVLRRTLIAATSLGVKRIEIVAAERVEKSFWQSHAVDPPAMREQLFLGLEQARDTRVPEVRLHRRFAAFASDVLPSRCFGRTGLLAHPDGASPPPVPWPTPALLAVGPEGGWVEPEIVAFEAAGLRAVGLGERILRVETAVALLLGRFA